MSGLRVTYGFLCLLAAFVFLVSGFAEMRAFSVALDAENVPRLRAAISRFTGVRRALRIRH